MYYRDQRLAKPAQLTMAILNISKKLLHQLLSNMVFLRIADAEIFDRLKAEHEITKGSYLSTRTDIFGSDDVQYGI